MAPPAGVCLLRWEKRVFQVRALSGCLLTLLAALAAQGCRTAPLPGQPLDDGALAAELRGALDAAYPRRFSTQHRVLLTVRGRGLTLSGLVACETPGYVRLLALTDVGTTDFAAEQSPGDTLKLLRAAPGFPADRFAENAVRTMERLFFARPSPDARLSRFGPDEVGFAESTPDGGQRVFTFDAVSRRLIRYVEAARNGRWRHRIEFSDHEVLTAWPQPIPRTIRIADRRGGYEATVRVLTLAQAGAVTPVQESGAAP